MSANRLSKSEWMEYCDLIAIMEDLVGDRLLDMLMFAKAPNVLPGGKLEDAIYLRLFELHHRRIEAQQANGPKS